MTAALTALPQAGPRAVAPGARVSQQGDFAQVLERVAASERRDAPAPRERAADRMPDRTADRMVDRMADRTEPVRDRASGRPGPRVPGEPDAGSTDAPTTSATDAAEGRAVESEPTAAPSDAPGPTAAPLVTDALLDSPDTAPVGLPDAGGTVPTDGPVVATDSLTALLAATAAPAPTATATQAATGNSTGTPVTPVGAPTTPDPVPTTAPTTAAVAGPVPALVNPVASAAVLDQADGTGPVPTATPELRPVAPGTEPATTPTPAADRGTGLPAAVPAPPVAAAPVPIAPVPIAPAPTAPVLAPPAAPVRATPVPLSEQLGARLTALTGPGGLSHGRHVLTVPIDPENLGPVRIVAHIGPESVRVELVGATEAAREALRGSLAELRRDLAASGLTVDVGSQGGRPEGRESDGRNPTTRGDARVPTAEPVVPVPVVPDRPPSGGLDLLA